MKTAVVGAGAMGSLFGGLLAASGENVTLVDVWREHVEAINAEGLRIGSHEGSRTISVKATTDPSSVGPVDLIIIFVKSYDTLEATRDALPMVSEDTVFLSLQNGLGNIEKISEVAGSDRVIPGTTAHGCTLIGPGEIFHAGSGPTIIGELDGRVTERARGIRDALEGAGIETRISETIRGALWSKVLVNVGINPLTALTGLRNGELLDHPDIMEAMRGAVEEAIRVAEALGVDLGEGDHVERVHDVARATASNKSSMLQDVERGRRTEIDALNGAIVDSARRLGLDVPVNETLTAAVRDLEDARARRDS
ncbi:2-dehydropantoate 2-reductase [Candidatus Bathyarchaeota archaeon]|nr:2-dehydropantoate 2-reductase [Candidatus Bathyarchaeota archaeon]